MKKTLTVSLLLLSAGAMAETPSDKTTLMNLITQEGQELGRCQNNYAMTQALNTTKTADTIVAEALEQCAPHMDKAKSLVREYYADQPEKEREAKIAAQYATLDKAVRVMMIPGIKNNVINIRKVYETDNR